MNFCEPLIVFYVFRFENKSRVEYRCKNCPRKKYWGEFLDFLKSNKGEFENENSIKNAEMLWLKIPFLTYRKTLCVKCPYSLRGEPLAFIELDCHLEVMLLKDIFPLKQSIYYE